MSAGSRRRAPMLWAPTLHGEDEDTRFDDHPPWDAVADEPALNPSQPSIAIPSVFPRAARPTPRAARPTPRAPEPAPPPLPRRMPKATPPAPITHTAPRSPMPMPMDASPAPMPAQQPVSPGQFYSYASQQLDSTVPVPPLPFAELATASVPRQIPRWSRIVMPIGGVVAVIAFAAAFFATRDHRPELPTIASVSRAEPVVAAAAPAPAVIPADSHWKPRAVVPTIAAEAPRTPTAIDSAAVDAAVEAATAVDATAVDATANDAVDPVVVAKPVAAKTIVRPKKRVHKPAKKAHRITRSSTKRRRVTVDASSPLGGLRPGMAW